MSQVRLFAIITTSASVAFVIRQFFKLRGAFDGLSNVVSFSARLIAGQPLRMISPIHILTCSLLTMLFSMVAARAEETTLEDAYVRDPLAVILAGNKAVTERKVPYVKGNTGTYIPNLFPYLCCYSIILSYRMLSKMARQFQAVPAVLITKGLVPGPSLALSSGLCFSIRPSKLLWGSNPRRPSSRICKELWDRSSAHK